MSENSTLGMGGISPRKFLHELYEGNSRRSRIFRWTLFTFDIVTIGYFLVTSFTSFSHDRLLIDGLIGIVLLLDLVARAVIADPFWKLLISPIAWADVLVILSLLAPLLLGGNFTFLRVLRALRIVRTFRLAQELRPLTRDLPVNTDAVVAAVNLIAFVFVTTSLVWVIEKDRNEDLNSWVDALYFTMTTLTTTGYGDITLDDRLGRILTIGIMIFGIGFFLKLLQALYQPAKVDVECRQCGLQKHDRDASHCKHCGEVIHIDTEGDV